MLIWHNQTIWSDTKASVEEQREDVVHKKQINQSLPEHVWLWQHSSEPRRKKIVHSKVQNTFIVHLSVWETIAWEREGKYKHNIYLVSPSRLTHSFFNVFLLLWGAPRDGWVEESGGWYVCATTSTAQSLARFQSLQSQTAAIIQLPKKKKNSSKNFLIFCGISLAGGWWFFLCIVLKTASLGN